MEIQIGATIVRLRHERGITQEALASAIGVSAPAVSKWETGQSYPDITLLPPLARYFGVRVDALLAYTPALDDAERDALFAEVESVFAVHGWAEGLARCDALLRTYPDDMLLRITLAGSLMQSLVFAPDDAQRQLGRQRQIDWLREAASSSEGTIQLQARALLGIFYLGNKQLDEAEEIFDSLKDMPTPVYSLMPTLRMLQDRVDDAMELAQRCLLIAIGDAGNALSTLTALAIRQDNTAGAVRYAELSGTLLKLLGLRGVYGFASAQARMSAAMASGDSDALLDAMTLYVQGLTCDTDPSDSPFFDRLQGNPTDENAAVRDQAIRSLIAEDFAANPAYDAVRKDDRFQRLVAALSEQA